MTRLAVPAVVAALLAGASLSCSSDSKKAATTAPTMTSTSTLVMNNAEPPPPAATKPPTRVKRKRIYEELARARDRGISGDALYQQVARREGIDVDSVVLIEHEGSLRRWALPAAPKLPAKAVRVRPSANAAKRLRSTVKCSANATRTGVARLRWLPSRPRGSRQWIAVTIYLKGFALGSFEASGPLGPRVSAFEWRRVHGQAIHYWRVITRSRNGRWLGSVTARFVGPTCVAEFEP